MKYIKKLTPVILTVLFLSTRIFILANPPEYFSDVTAYYEVYANIWRYGLTPYLEHLFEYPPAAVPLISIPLDLDQMGIGKYYLNYRIETFLIETAFFIFMYLSMGKVSWLKKKKLLLLSSYIVLTTVAKNFFYEGLDLAFTAAIFSSFLSILWYKSGKVAGQTLTWTLFWLSTAIKFLTLPLMVPLFLVLRTDWKKSIIAFVAGFLIVWGLPLAIYRSSLQVSFVYNLSRPIKYASFPAHLIRWADLFTESEEQSKLPPDFEFLGPVSDTVTRVNKLVFPLSVALVLLWSSYTLIKMKSGKKKLSLALLLSEVKKPKQLKVADQFTFLLRTYGVYVFVLFLTAKTFSQPFHIWYLPLLVLFPFTSQKKWWLAFGMMLLMVALDTTEWLHLSQPLRDYEALPVPLLRDSLRFIPMGVMIALLLGKNLTNKKS